MRALTLLVAVAAAACAASTQPGAAPTTAGTPPAPAPAAPAGEAQRAAFSYQGGVRIEHWLHHVAPRYVGRSNVAHTYAAAWFDDEDLRWIAQHGFDHVVIPTSAEEVFAVGGEIAPEAIAPLERVIASANELGLGVVVELAGAPRTADTAPRYDPDETFDPTDPAEQQRRAEAWGRLARHFAGVGEGLRFGHAESALPLTPDPNVRLRAYLAAIRESSPTRFFYVMPPMRARTAGEAHYLSAPPGASTEHLRALDFDGTDGFDAHVGAKLTYREPEAFIFQRPRQGPAIPFPGVVPADAEDRAAPFRGQTLSVADIDATFARVAEWRKAHPDRELYLGEFGMVEGVDPGATRRYLEAVTGAARRHGIGWAIYDYESGCAVRGEDGEPTAIYHGLGLP
jgi:hypothetical protein